MGAFAHARGVSSGVSPVVKAHLRKGQLHIAMKDTFRASEAYRKALELDPNCSVSGGWTHLTLPSQPTNLIISSLHLRRQRKGCRSACWMMTQRHAGRWQCMILKYK